MTRDPHALHPLRAVADALGVPHRTVRWWADSGKLDTLQPERYMERLVPTSELKRFERLGYRIRWDALELAEMAKPSHAVLDTETAIP